MEIKLTLSLDETNTVINALAKLPYEYSAPVIEKVKAQAVPQVQAAEAAQAPQAQAVEVVQ
jgi:hypothetical protein